MTTPVDYEVKTPGRRHEKKTYHINLLKKWHSAESRTRNACLVLNPSMEGEDDVQTVGVCDEYNLYPIGDGATDVELQIVSAGLSGKQQDQLQALMAEFPSVFQTTPGCTTVIEHEINVGDVTPIRQRPYRLPYSRREIVKEELEKMIAAGVVQPSGPLQLFSWKRKVVEPDFVSITASSTK